MKRATMITPLIIVTEMVNRIQNTRTNNDMLLGELNHPANNNILLGIIILIYIFLDFWKVRNLKMRK